MLRLVKITGIVLAITYIIFHLVTLSSNPLPWYDETYFVSIALDLKNHSSFFPMVAYHAKVLKEDFAYGPVYFLLTGISFKLFGFGIFQFRIVNFLFGLILIWLFSKILKLYHHSTPIILLVTTAFLLDPFLNLSLHEARMDLVTFVFIISSAYILLKSWEKENLKIVHIFISGLLAVTALLTSPRVGFIYLTLSIVWLIWLIKNFSKENILKVALWFATAITVYALWMYYAFGGIQELLSYYKELQKEEAAGYIGFLKPIYFIPRHEWLLIICAIISLLYKLVSDDIKLNYFYLFSILSIVVFYLIVVDIGPYSVLIIPFYYFIIADSLKDLSFKKFKNPFLYLSLFLLIFNFGYFSLKALQVAGSMEQRNYKAADEFIKNYIPPGSKVVGDPLYYYSVIKAGSDYQYFNKYATHKQREQIHREEYDYDYLIITDQSKARDPEAVTTYFSNAKFKKIARFEKKPTTFTKNLFGLGWVSSTENNGYNADLFVRLKMEQSFPTAINNVKF